MSSYNPFSNQNNKTTTTAPIFGGGSTQPSIFGNNNNGSTNIFGANNNQNPTTSTLFGNNTNTNNSNTTATFGFNNNSNTNQNITFGANSNTNNILGANTSTSTNTNTSNLFGVNTNPNTSTNNIFGTNNNTNNTNNNLFGLNNQNNNNNTQASTTNNLFNNLSGINNQSNNNNNNNVNNNNNNNNQQNLNINPGQYLDLNNPKIRHDLSEFKEVLINCQKCTKQSEVENMFKDYLYLPIPKGKTNNEVNNYRPFTLVNNNEKIINDYNIWDSGNKNNPNPNELFPVQISSVDSLLVRNKLLEKGILITIARTVENEENLERLNKKIDEEMNNKISELKQCNSRINELELNLSSKITQYNYLVGNAKENVNATKELKENLKKANDNITTNNMLEVCEKIKKSCNENFTGENHNYIKDINKEKMKTCLDALVEIENMMTVVDNNNKKNLSLINSMMIELDKVLKKNKL